MEYYSKNPVCMSKYKQQLTKPAIGVDNLFNFLIMPGLILLISLEKEKQNEKSQHKQLHCMSVASLWLSLLLTIWLQFTKPSNALKKHQQLSVETDISQKPSSKSRFVCKTGLGKYTETLKCKIQGMRMSDEHEMMCIKGRGSH